MFIDSHCHLDRLDLSSHNGSLNEALGTAREQHVNGFLCVGIGFENTDRLLEIESTNSDVWLSMGVHPLEENLSIDPAELKKWCALSQVVAIGETGLDYHYRPETKPVQLEAFKTHLIVSAELNKPVIVHTREAQEDTIHLIRKYGGEAAGVLHCFTESWEMAEEALDLGYYISISGIVTFKNAEALRDVVRNVPLERLLIETDSPYLAPVPKRGKPNDPSLLPYVAECVASLKGVSVGEIAQATSDNFFRLFPAAVRSKPAETVV
ncbi:UNVERIFIED_CONTAM: hypothetical protein GTU68_062643 [Idotea baltica]|nr:hypothetical protein [Idotea baltica]